MKKYDYIVVGAGSSGAVIAARLSEDPNCSVALIEAGGLDNTTFMRKPGMIMIFHTVKQINEKYNWGYSTEPTPALDNKSIGYYRGRVLGGCSSINGMVYVRGHRKNFDDWAAEGNTGWSYDDVRPYFKKFENYRSATSPYRGDSGPINVQLSPKTSPITHEWTKGVAQSFDTVVNPDYNGEDQEGASVLQVNAWDGVRQSTSVCYLDPVKNGKRPNLDIIITGMVTRVLLEGTKCVGVEVLNKQGKKEEIRCEQEVIISAGALNSPAILMHSGIGPKAHLEEVGIPCVQDLPVGENLHDHAFIPLVFNTPLSNNRSTAGYIFKGLMKEYLGGGGSFLQTSMFENVAFVRSGMNFNEGIPDMQVHAMPWAYPPNPNDPGIPTVDKNPSLSMMPTLIYPKSRGYVRLRSNDPLDKPICNPNYLGDPRDKEFLFNGVDRIRDMMSANPMSTKHTGEVEPGPKAFDRAALENILSERFCTVYHPVGTCRMGVDDYAVVDPKLRVRGIQNLRVADCSIMPSITGGNTNAPAIMIGERAAALIQEGK